MAEMIVNLVMDELVLFLVQEGEPRAAHEDVWSIKADLEFLRPFLRDVDARAERGEIETTVIMWMRELMKVSLKLEDVIDKYKLRSARLQSQRRGFYCCHGGCFSSIMFHSRYKLSQNIQEIQDIATTIRNIQERGGSYGLRVTEEGSSSSWQHHRRWRHDAVEEDDGIVGIEVPQDQLRSWLRLEGPPNRTVISVVGAGGIGKTTLIRKVYNKEIACGNFLCHAWIHVSQSYKRDELLRSLIEQLYNATKQSVPHQVETLIFDEGSLISTLKQYLQDKRYMVVFDDVCSAELWESIKISLPDNNKSSRVIVTARMDAVASSFITTEFDHFLKLNPLTQEQSMQLFLKMVLDSNHGFFPRELMALAEKIVYHLDGLPLAIVSIGGLLSTKDATVFEWQRMYDILSSELGSHEIHPQNVNKILSLSYHDLSYFLKPCFLYFGIFPEDYSICHGRLVRSWIAEGFIKEMRGKTLEEIAEEYLTELIRRNMVQVSRVNSIGKARNYRVHDVIRNRILSMTKDMDFYQLLSEENSYFDGEARRLSVHSRKDDVLESINSQSGIRSVFTFGEDKFPELFVGKLIANLKLVKVLDFEDAPIDFLPEEVGNLLLLKYLNLRNTKVKTLPKSIGRLHNLLILDIKNSLISELPSVINRLHKLRHLLAYVVNQNIGFQQGYQQGVKIHEGLGRLEALQKLYFVDALSGRGLFRELEKLRQLRKLGIKNLKTKDGVALCTAIENMNHLETLDVWPVRKDDILDLKHISSPPQSLQQLYLKGRLESFPSWISKLQCLVRIKLLWSRLKNDPLEFLQDLPMLLELELMDAYDGEMLNFKERGFMELRVLKLVALDALSSVIVEAGALPLLQTVHISSCRQLQLDLLPKQIAEIMK